METLAELVEQCSKETDRFFRSQNYDPGYCFELFRRAIVDQDQLAWEAIITQYHSLVGKWVIQHPGFETSGEEAQYFVNRSFEKIWVALISEKFQGFNELGFLLRYLKMCVHSVISDHHRSLELAELVELTEEAADAIEDDQPSLEDSALDRMDRKAFWDSINARLHDEKEQKVVYGSFVLALKPREIFEHSQGMFESIDEVYLVKQNILSRLRRDVELSRLIRIRD
jgi:hypothetical protein